MAVDQCAFHIFSPVASDRRSGSGRRSLS